MAVTHFSKRDIWASRIIVRNPPSTTAMSLKRVLMAKAKTSATGKPKMSKKSSIWNTLFEIFIFCPKIQLWFPEKIVDFFWVKNSWKCCGFGLFSCWQLWFHEKNFKKFVVKNSWKCWGFVKIDFLDKNLTFRIVWSRMFFLYFSNLQQNWVMTLMYDFFRYFPSQNWGVFVVWLLFYWRSKIFCSKIIRRGIFLGIRLAFEFSGAIESDSKLYKFWGSPRSSPIMSALVGIWLPSSAAEAVSRCNGKNLITFSSSIMQNCLDPLMLLE